MWSTAQYDAKGSTADEVHLISTSGGDDERSNVFKVKNLEAFKRVFLDKLSNNKRN